MRTRLLSTAGVTGGAIRNPSRGGCANADKEYRIRIGFVSG